ncbi:MAG: hypothetical protein HKN50_00590 [Gammaproteobacteria bacterium]|nr:hypothetical protein [Gammaproteobacteria bacterium]
MTDQSTATDRPEGSASGPTASDSYNWLLSDYGQRYLAAEAPLLESALKHLSGPRVLQVGRLIQQSVIDRVDFPQLIITDARADTAGRVQIQADPAFLPIQAESMASVLLPHVLEQHALPHQVLREAHRVLVDDGCVVLSGFSPLSMMGVQRWLRPPAVLLGDYYRVSRVIDWLQLLGFEVIGSAMCQYAPLSRSQRVGKTVGWLDTVGERWLPMSGGGYIITARKRVYGTTLVGRLRFAKPKRKLAGTAPARTALQRNKLS